MRSTRINLAAMGLALAAVLAACSGGAAGPETPESAPGFLSFPSPSPSATLAVAMNTPAPLPTPGPTPAPIVHTVKAGETLIGIAVVYGVTVEGIQVLNPGLQPELIQPGQQLIIPAPSSESNSGILPSPTPVPVELGPVTCFETPAGSRWCLFEAHNPGTEPVENVSVLVTLASAEGVPLVTQIAFAPVSLVPPGGSVPLSAWFAPMDGSPAGAAAQLLGAEPAANAAARYTPARVEATASESDGGTLTVRGEVAIESGAGPARLISLVLSLYNEQGMLIGLRKQVWQGEWAAGQTLPFEIFAAALAGEVADHRLILEAQP